MKKLWITLVALLIAVFSVGACAEEREAILFRGIPWLCSIDEAVEILLGNENVPAGKYEQSRYTHLKPWSIEYSRTQINEGGFEYKWSGDNKLFVAGYSISEYYLYALYGHSFDAVFEDIEQSKFYRGLYYFDAPDKKTAYADLQTKLTVLYGEPSEVFLNTDEMWSVWYDKNGAGLLLEWTAYSTDGFLSLDYGLVESEKMIKELQEAYRQENIKNAGDMYDGL